MCLSVITLIDAKHILALGDGTGVNCALINANSSENIHLTHVDLGQYLLMQYIVNYQWRSNATYLYAENFSNTRLENVDLLINMDSFPEMTVNEVEKYISFVKNNNVKYLLSYNHKIFDNRHSNFREYIFKADMKLLISYESLVRPGWFVELFKLK